jgi:ATP-dependent 26S proteasome regulatory subunit
MAIKVIARGVSEIVRKFENVTPADIKNVAKEAGIAGRFIVKDQNGNNITPRQVMQGLPDGTILYIEPYNEAG